MAKKTKYDETVLDAVKNLMTDKASYHTRDQDDLDSARSALSGFSFDEKDKEYRGMRPEVTIPVLNTWMNQVISAYTSAPFGIGLKSQRQDLDAYRFVFDNIQKNLSDFAGRALVEELGVGYTYGLVTNEIVNLEMNWQVPTIKLIDARKVIVGDCEDPELDDCDIALVIDVMAKTKAKNKFNLDDYDLRGGRDILYGFDVVSDSKSQCSVITVYERIAAGVQVTKIVYNKIVDQIILPLTRLPLVRFYGDTTYIEKEVHYRGIYNLIAGMWKMIDYGASDIQAKIATAPTGNWKGDPASIAENPELYETGAETQFYPARKWDGDKEMPDVQQVDRDPHVEGLINAVNTLFTWVTSTLGSPTAEVRANETAEAVLARKSLAESTVNKYLNNLKKSLKSLGTVILEMIAIAYDVPRIEEEVELPALTDINGITVTVDDGPIQASQKQKNLQQILAFYSIAKESNPNAFQMIGPQILALSDMPVEIKQALTGIFNQEAPMNPQVQQAMMQKDQQLAQAQAQMTEMNKNIAMLQQSLFEMQTDSKSKLLSDQMKIASDERKQINELAWEREKFMMEMQAKGLKVQVDVNEADKDRQLDSEQHREEMVVELEKDREETRRQAQQIQVPLFTASKFT